MEVSLLELHCKVNNKEERPLFSQFKVISNNDIPKISEQTKTLIGRYKKDKNVTQYRWDYDKINMDGPRVKYDISLETLKQSTIQVLLKIDRNFAEHQTEKVLDRLRNRNKTMYDHHNAFSRT